MLQGQTIAKGYLMPLRVSRGGTEGPHASLEEFGQGWTDDHEGEGVYNILNIGKNLSHLLPG